MPLQAAQLEAAQAGGQRSEEQLVALSTQLAQQQQDAEELQVAHKGGWVAGLCCWPAAAPGWLCPSF